MQMQMNEYSNTWRVVSTFCATLSIDRVYQLTPTQ